MKTRAKQSIKLDHLNLAPVVKTDVSNLIQALQNELKLLAAKNQALTLELAHLRRIRYGAKSEAVSRSQLSLFEEDWQTDMAAIAAEIEQLPLPAPQQPKRAHAGRQSLPDHLPRIEHRHEPQSCQCKQCATDSQLAFDTATFYCHAQIALVINRFLKQNLLQLRPELIIEHQSGHRKLVLLVV